jgi:hypothetical protein
LIFLRKGTTLACLSPQDERLLVAAIGLAHRARGNGNHPFGALLAAPAGEVLCEAENTVVTNGDVTGHAELNLVSKACRALTAGQLATAILYTSTEPVFAAGSPAVEVSGPHLHDAAAAVHQGFWTT